MSARTNLEALESDLIKSKDFEGKKGDAASVVRAYFISQKGPDPTNDQMNEHFLQRSYSKTELGLFDGEAGELYSTNELEESFFDLICIALYSRFRENLDESNAYFSKAKRVADLLKNPFIMGQYDYTTVLGGDMLNTKLKTDRCYELVNKTLVNEHDKSKGFALIGTGLSLAEQIQDSKRKLDFFAKCHYALYEIDAFPHVAMSLGRYILSETKDYHSLNGWAHFHNGNIWLDLEDPRSAKEQFEEALDWAIQSGFPYAAMTLYERLGLTHKNLNKQNLAQQNYEESLGIGETEDIRPWLVSRNEVRCLIGLGLIQFEIGKSQSGAARAASLQVSESYLKKAVETANQINYPANAAAALSSLGELYRFRGGSNNIDAKCFHRLAFQIKTEVLGLDPICRRVKRDSDYM